MAANFGKFIDRSPQICAAGMPSALEKLDHNEEVIREDDVEAVLKESSLEDNAKFIQDEKEHTETYFALPEKVENINLEEAAVEVQLLQSPTSREVLKLMNLSETNIKNVVHSQDEDSVMGLMHPPKSPYQVMWDSQVGHERYRTTHDDYNAPKKIEKREVISEPEKCLKAAGKYNSKGVWVKCLCDWHNKKAIDISSGIEADYVDRHRSQVGKSLNPNHNIDSVPKGFAFGVHSGHTSYHMEELMKDSNCPPCVFRRDFYKWMAALNKCRNTLREREFDFEKLYGELLDEDDQKTGFLPVDEVYNICAQEQIAFHKEEIEELLNVLKILVDGKIDYRRFIEIIDVNKPTIDIVPFHDLPSDNQYYETTNQAAVYLITSKADLPPAGMTSAQDHADKPNVAHRFVHSSGESKGSPLNFGN